MAKVYNIYCDESCHLEHDQQKAMVLGALWCPAEKVKDIFKDIRAIKEKYGLNKKFEIKWTKVSPAKEDFYLSLVKYFFENSGLHFRALVVPDKTKLDHNAFYGQTHDVFYYKMYFDMLKTVIDLSWEHGIFKTYMDIKDSKSTEKVHKLHKYLCNKYKDFNADKIKKVQGIRSHEVEIVQLADLLIGAVSYVNRDIKGSAAKKNIVTFIQKKGKIKLTKTNNPQDEKFNILVWNPAKGRK